MKERDLLEFYLEQFWWAYHRMKKKTSFPKYMHRINLKISSMKKMHMHPGMEKQCSQLHNEVRRLAFAAYASGNKIAKNKIKGELIPELIRIDLELFHPKESDFINEEMIKEIRQTMPGAICKNALSELVSQVRKGKLRKEMMERVPSRPELEFPEALAMERKFILHVGPTNSGKTYQALERLKKADQGIYLGPLRLLALEVYETMHEAGTLCMMLTGQECMEDPGYRVISSTVEMLDLDRTYDVAVIDEAQMVADELRGHSWTRAILGIRAQEIHVCMSPDAVKVVTHLIELCGDTYECNWYERKTPLEVEKEPFSFPDDVQDGDALVVFSKKAVLNIAGRLEEKGIEASVIYGSLPPEIRRKQMQLFLRGETKVVVSTDAIGMGLNLPVRRVVFLAAEKFDGKNQRALEISEIKQIAGRAGRFQLYETGYVTAMDKRRLHFIQKQMEQEILEMTKVTLGFPQVLLSMDAPLDEILLLWKKELPKPPFEKINIDDMLFLYREAYRRRASIVDFDDKFLLYRMITCPIDIKDREVIRLWNEYCTTYSADVKLKHPSERSRYDGLLRAESYYKKLDLYFQFSYRMGKWIDNEWLEKEREKTQNRIMDYLSEEKQDYILRCKYCGRILPVDAKYRVCRRCYGNRNW